MSAEIIDVMMRGNPTRNVQFRARLYERNPENLRKLLQWERVLVAAKKRVAPHWWRNETAGCA